MLNIVYWSQINSETHIFPPSAFWLHSFKISQPLSNLGRVEKMVLMLGVGDRSGTFGKRRWNFKQNFKIRHGEVNFGPPMYFGLNCCNICMSFSSLAGSLSISWVRGAFSLRVTRELEKIKKSGYGIKEKAPGWLLRTNSRCCISGDTTKEYLMILFLAYWSLFIKVRDLGQRLFSETKVIHLARLLSYGNKLANEK